MSEKLLTSVFLLYITSVLATQPGRYDPCLQEVLERLDKKDMEIKALMDRLDNTERKLMALKEQCSDVRGMLTNYHVFFHLLTPPVMVLNVSFKFLCPRRGHIMIALSVRPALYL